MAVTGDKTVSRPTSQPARRRRGPSFFAWKPILIAVLPFSLAWYYFVMVAPGEVPVPPGLKVPFPELVPHLERMCVWCGGHPFWIAAILAGILAGGILAPWTPGRYYAAAIIIVSLFTAFTYFSVSAPIERLLRTVKDNLPEERKLPDYLPEKR